MLKNFLDIAEADVRSLISLYSEVVGPVIASLSSFSLVLGREIEQEFACSDESLVYHPNNNHDDVISNSANCYLFLVFGNFLFQGRNADSLSQYFGEDPARCPFEQGLTSSLFIYTHRHKD